MLYRAPVSVDPQIAFIPVGVILGPGYFVLRRALIAFIPVADTDADVENPRAEFLSQSSTPP